MELLVFGHAGERVLVFPTRQGRFYDYENWRQVEAVRDFIEAGAIQLFCVDSIDSESLYCRHRSPRERIIRHCEYEAYIIEEVTPFMASKNGAGELVAHGCSIGAYHAVNIALRHPELFSRVVAFSGRYDLTRPAGVFPDLFCGYYDQDIYFHTPNHFLPGLSDDSILTHLRRLAITITVGEHDPFRDSSCELSRVLAEKGVSHQLFIWDGEAHRARSWRHMAWLYLRNGH
jgi:esterase/lipase superfamily enzyme